MRRAGDRQQAATAQIVGPIPAYRAATKRCLPPIEHQPPTLALGPVVLDHAAQQSRGSVVGVDTAALSVKTRGPVLSQLASDERGRAPAAVDPASDRAPLPVEADLGGHAAAAGQREPRQHGAGPLPRAETDHTTGVRAVGAGGIDDGGGDHVGIERIAPGNSDRLAAKGEDLGVATGRDQHGISGRGGVDRVLDPGEVERNAHHPGRRRRAQQQRRQALFPMAIHTALPSGICSRPENRPMQDEPPRTSRAAAVGFHAGSVKPSAIRSAHRRHPESGAGSGSGSDLDPGTPVRRNVRPAPQD